MDSIRLAFLLGLVASLGCGGPEGSSDYTDCDQQTSCRGEVCTTVEDCWIDECEWELTYLFAGEEYESTCQWGPRVKTTVYPLEGGPGTRRVESDIEQCFYWAEVQFYDYEEERRCTTSRECTVKELSCAPSSKGDPDCTVIEESPCRGAPR